MRYRCPDCDWEIQGNSGEIHDIIEHEKIHYKKIDMVEIELVKKCEECGGTGTIKERVMVDKNELPETD